MGLKIHEGEGSYSRGREKRDAIRVSISGMSQ